MQKVLSLVTEGNFGARAEIIESSSGYKVDYYDNRGLFLKSDLVALNNLQECERVVQKNLENIQYLEG